MEFFSMLKANDFSVSSTSLRVMMLCKELLPPATELAIFLSSPVVIYLLSIARYFSKREGAQTITVGHIFATALYCSPEQVIRQLTQQECLDELRLLAVYCAGSRGMLFNQFVNDLHCILVQVQDMLDDRLRNEVVGCFAVELANC